MKESFDASEYRRILGHYPTGVCAITAAVSRSPVGMIVGSFTSVSLKPPLVAFVPDRGSTTWPMIRSAGRFCVKVLSAAQQDVCRALSAKGENKFEALSYRWSATGLPILDGVVAWIDCVLYAVHEAGDHDIALGEVAALQVEAAHPPMLFLKGAYGSFSADFAKMGIEVSDAAVS